MKIFIAVVQRPMASLDVTDVKAFRSYEEAERWMESLLADEDVREGFSVEEMNYHIYEQEVAV